MPTYQYVCTECNEPLEAVQRFSDDSLTECPVCGGRLRKVFSAVGVVFKGSGFYRTDSRAGSRESNGAAAASSASSSSNGSKEAPSTSSDSSPSSSSSTSSSSSKDSSASSSSKSTTSSSSAA